MLGEEEVANSCVALNVSALLSTHAHTHTSLCVNSAAETVEIF